MRRLFVALLAGCLVHAGAMAQSWPDKPTRFVVPFPAGGVLDALTRTVAAPLQSGSGKTIVVENNAGGAGNIGIQQVMRSPGDGATMLLIPQGNITINATLMPDLPFKWERDFKPVTLLAYAANVLVVNPALPVNSVAELVAFAKANPGKLNYASPGIGSSLHLIGELFAREAKIDIVHVPYKGTTPAMQDLMGGQVQMMFGALPTLMPMIKSGKLRALAVTTARRAEAAPALPTLAESGMKNIDVPSWYGVMAPAATPDAVVASAQSAFAAALATPAVREQLQAQGLTPVGSRPADFAAQIRRETESWAQVIRVSGIKVE